MRAVTVLLLSVAACALAVPGVQVSLSAAGFSSLAGTLVADVAARVPASIPVPGGTDTKFSCVGTCHFKIKGGSVTGIKCPTHSYTLGTGGAMQVRLVCGATLAVDYEIHRSTFPSASCSGSIDGTLEALSVVVPLTAGANAANGALQLTVGAVALALGDDPLSFHGNDICKKLCM